jgi:hypothetical protein
MVIAFHGPSRRSCDRVMGGPLHMKPNATFYDISMPRVTRVGRPSSQGPITAAIRSLVAEGKLPNKLSRKQNIELVRVRVHALFPGHFAGDSGLARETIANYLAQELARNTRPVKSSADV